MVNASSAQAGRGRPARQRRAPRRPGPWPESCLAGRCPCACESSFTQGPISPIGSDCPGESTLARSRPGEQATASTHACQRRSRIAACGARAEMMRSRRPAASTSRPPRRVGSSTVEATPACGGLEQRGGSSLRPSSSASGFQRMGVGWGGRGGGIGAIGFPGMMGGCGMMGRRALKSFERHAAMASACCGVIRRGGPSSLPAVIE